MAVTDDILWRLIEARDRAFGRAHVAFETLTRQAREKDQEITLLEAAIVRLKSATTEKDAEIVRLKSAATEKDEEIQRLTHAAADRLDIIRQLQASREYRAGRALLHPWQALRGKKL